MKIKVLTILLILCVFICGCSDQRLSQPLEVAFFGEVDVDAPQAGGLGPPPPHITSLLWGDMEDDLDHALRVLQAYEKGDISKSVLEGHLWSSIVRQLMSNKYYTKYIDAGGVVILGNDHIDDNAFYAAREIVFGMTSKRPEIRKYLTLRRKGDPPISIGAPTHRFRYILVHVNQGTAAVPEWYTKPLRAIGWCTSNWCTSPVNTYLSLETGGIRTLNAGVFIHEFAHAMDWAIRQIDPTFLDRLVAAYEVIKDDVDGYWGGGWNSGNAALRNAGEYWAFSADRWFTRFTSGTKFGEQHHTRFKERDPLMYALLQEWFDFKYLGHVESKVYE